METEDSLLNILSIINRRAPRYIDLLAATTEAEFDSAFDAILETALRGLEANSRNFQDLDEVGLSGALALGLNLPGLTVTCETHSNGHVDITISGDYHTPAKLKLGEAKIYRGPAYHISGMQQLVGRYTNGRECRGLMIVYCREPDIAGKMNGIRRAVDEQLPCGQTNVAADGPFHWTFTTEHNHSSGETLGVTHYGCNMHVANP